MRPIDRLYKYLNYSKLRPSSFEHSSGISNGYLNKQFKGKGTVGSDIIEKIHRSFPDLNMTWVLTGKGTMIVKTDNDPVVGVLKQEEMPVSARDEVVILLRKQLAVLEAAVQDKDRIITLLEEQLALKKTVL